MRILLLSAYDGTSHRHWRRQLVSRLTGHQWTVLTLPGYHFSWRIRGNPLSWLTTEARRLDGEYDLILATSMVDLATLKGLFPSLARVPCLCYFHENQFAYPNQQQQPPVEPMMVNLYTALAAERLLFNSEYNRSSFMEGADRLMRKLPDLRPKPVSDLLQHKSSVLPVPLAPPENDRPQAPGADPWRCAGDDSVVKIAWAARWEHDKGPDRLLAVVRTLNRRGLDYRLCLMGERFRAIPEEFDRIAEQAGERLVQFGYADSREHYLWWLSTADCFLSTSIHEFQGLSVLEAMAAGCMPVLPARLSYPELVPPRYLYPSRLDDIDLEAEEAVTLIERLQRGQPGAPSVKPFTWPALHEGYVQALAECAGVGVAEAATASVGADNGLSVAGRRLAGG